MTTTPNPIDSLPPTDERVGIPAGGDGCECNKCGFIGEVGRVFHLFGDGAVACDVCDSTDITGHDVASLRGVRR